MNLNNNLPWVEKYRPGNFSEIISHIEIINTLDNLILCNKLPHMIFYGPPGTGKTTTILATAKKIYGKNYHTMILELNGSDDRGINVVREQIKNFSAIDSKISNILVGSESNIDSNIRPNIKLVILDEADAMTYDAQFALRRVIESYTDSTRFCLICNYLTKIIPALQSRCQMFRFRPIINEDHLIKINMVIQNENILIEDLAKKKIVELSDGDMRKSLNLLQSLYMINSQFENNIITLNSVYKLVGHPTEDERYEIINTLNNKDLKSIYQTLNRLESEKSLSNQDIIKEISSYFGKTFILNYKNQKLAKLKSKSKLANIRMGIKEQIKILDLFDKLAKIEVNISTNTNTNIQLLAISSIINNYNSI